MRVTLFLLLCFIVVGLFLWSTFSGALLIIGILGLLLFVVVSMGYSDTLILFFLGAREVRSGDEKIFYEAAAQEAYKLSLKVPKLYYYNGTLERAFVLQKGSEVSIVLDKKTIEHAQHDELTAICFELLLQVKKGLASKRTKTLFVLGSLGWFFHSLMGLIAGVLPFENVRKAFAWIISYLVQPVLDLLFKLLLGEKYFKKLELLLNEFPHEKQLLNNVGMKLHRHLYYYSLPSKKLLELSSAGKSRHYQNIMAIEFLPHEWDYFFRHQDLKNAQ